MAKSLLPKIMYRNFNLPKVAALIHSLLLVLLLTSFIIWLYVILAPNILSAESGRLGFAYFHFIMLNYRVPMMMAFGLLLGLNGLINYLLFRLREKPAAYSMSVLLVTVQAAIFGSGIMML